MATFYKTTGLIGGGAWSGGTGNLDAIDGANLAAGDVALTYVAGRARQYLLKDSAGAVEDSPWVIIPDSNPGNLWWDLHNVGEEGIKYLYADYVGDLSAALTAIGATETVLVMDVDNTVSADLTVPTTTVLRYIKGVATTLADGVTLTVNGPLNLSEGGFFDGTSGGGTETLTINGAIIGDYLNSYFFGTNLTVNGKPKIEYVSPCIFGAVKDAITDDTTAIQKAIDLATVADHIPVCLPVGRYLITNTINRHEGITIIGQSPGATSETYGVWVLHASNNTLFLCDGNGRAAAGVGGGFKNLSIIKVAGYAGGDGIKYLATDSSHRPGEEYIENVLVYGQSTALWDRALHIDGTACDVSGDRGVREVIINKFRFADCQISNESMLINQGTAVTGTHIQMDIGGSTGTPGITIKGTSSYVQLTNTIINGDVLIEGTNTYVNINGHIQTLTQNQTNLIGGFSGTISGAIINQSHDFKLNTYASPKFRAVLTATVANVTGDDTDYTILFNSEKYDEGNGYNTVTGIFTAVSAGTYRFDAQVVLSGLDIAHTRADPYLILKTSLGVERERTSKIFSPYSSSVTGYTSYDLAAQFEMNYGDTVEVVANTQGGTKVVGVYGSTGSESTFFEGALI